MVITESGICKSFNKHEKNEFERNGNIRRHNSVLRYKDILYSEIILSKTDDAFYDKLKKAVTDNELSKEPVIPSLIMLVIELFFIMICVSAHLKPLHLLMFTAVPAVMFIFSAVSVIKESFKIHRVLDCIKQKKNIYGVSFEIDGKCICSDDSAAKSYYVISGPVLICVPEKIYNKSESGRKLLGAVVGAGKNRRFYAVEIK